MIALTQARRDSPNCKQPTTTPTVPAAANKVCKQEVQYHTVVVRSNNYVDTRVDAHIHQYPADCELTVTIHNK